VKLGKAVPAGDEVPSLIYELAQASNQKSVDFSSIVSGGGASSPAPTAASAAASAASGGLSLMPFTFVFNGTYLELYHLFGQLNRFTMRTANGGLEVNGRLLTIQSVKLAPSSGEAGSSKNAGRLTGTITATAYELPAVSGMSSGATAASPTGSAAAATSTVASPSSSGSPSTPAIVRVNP
jgi:hypothetical protein